MAYAKMVQLPAPDHQGGGPYQFLEKIAELRSPKFIETDIRWNGSSARRQEPMSLDEPFANGSTSSVLLDWILLALSAVTTAILFAWLLYYSGYGLDFSDEGLYLNSIANPFAYAINIPVSLFGFVYHWPYQWVRGDIAALRAANITLTMALGWILAFLVIRRLWTAARPHAVVLSAGVANLTLVAFHLWLPTPNYNTLNFQSLSMVMIGLLLADQPGLIRKVLGCTVIGVGGWCCFMAKPSTAAAIALVVMLHVVFLRRRSLLPMLGAALIALILLLVSAYLIDGGITGFLTRMVKSAQLEILFGARHEISHMFRIDWLITSRSQLAIAVLLATALLLNILIGSTHKLLSSMVLAVMLIVTIAIALLGIDPIKLEPSPLFLVPAFTWLGAMFYRRGLVLRTQIRTSIALATTFLILPHLFALGSFLNYWRVAWDAALFWMLAVVAFLSPLAEQGRSFSTLVAVTVLAQLLTASVINAGIVKPFRQVKDLRAYTAVTPMPGGGKLVLSELFHDYLTTARVQARAAGLEAGTPVIDLSGRSPGLLYVLEARALGLPWLAGGYPGSNALAVETLRLENCTDLAKAWVLIEPEGPRRLNEPGVMASFGSGQADYVAAATFVTRASPSLEYDEYPNAYRQFLLKPVRPAALAEQSCREARRKRPNGQTSQW
ncbi:hypothetical protein [Bradyrhizobium sp. CB3481]|uniref:hypothetical protein n=1 Tax=Bradyrhizobium sp. CB3481 TaxID=3039158 RepID=UPI0024B11E91|nr:hypothetical protein [Bradyrhizobium sp. CB3481]WFU14572.1 hypothetical protein QA643_26020 [Bradyrhizobium sp. CB3481]